MTVWNLGSINVDNFYRVPHLPRRGETIVATEYRCGLGGKGANMSVAIARAAARVSHIGCVGKDGVWARDRLLEYGVDTRHILIADEPTGHANITVDPLGENQIVIHPGANQRQDFGHIQTALQNIGPSDWLLLQNETSHQVETARLARANRAQVAYSAAPFDPVAVEAILPFVTLLIMNAVEAAQLRKALGQVPVPCLLITKGAGGADWTDRETGEALTVPAFPVTPVDTTGAGDTFAGYAIAALSQGLAPEQALTRAAAAAALQVTRHGTADAIPSLADVLDLIG